jgi:glucose-1-phosphate adenylyltransferase
MERKVLGLIVTAAGESPLGTLGTADVALTPFAGKYRFIDFALATLVNSGVTDIYVFAPEPILDVERHLARTAHVLGPPRRQTVIPLPVPRATARLSRLLEVLSVAHPLVRAHHADGVVLLSAEHILLADLRQLFDAHDGCGADATLAAFPVFSDDAFQRPLLRVDAADRVRKVERFPADDAGFSADTLAWAGDLVVRSAFIPDLLAARAAGDEATLLGTLCTSARLSAYNVLENRVPGRPGGHGAYWHEPTTVEEYYRAQMELCTSRPALDLYNPAWPLSAAGTGLAPAKVVTDSAGRAGQALDALVSDGSVIQGGVVIKSVLGHGVLVDSGAEVEDSILLDGCRIGPGARVRRAVVGAGAVIGEGESIGYGEALPAHASLRNSGLTLVPPAAR